MWVGSLVLKNMYLLLLKCVDIFATIDLPPHTLMLRIKLCVNMLVLQIGAHAIIAYLTGLKRKIMIDFFI